MKRHYLFSYCNIAMLIVIVLFSMGTIRVKRLLDLRGLNRLANWKRTKKALRKIQVCLSVSETQDLSSGVLYQSNEHIPFWSQHFQPYSYSTMPDAWLWQSIYGPPAPNLRLIVMCEIVPGASLHSIHRGFWCGRSQPLWFLCSELVPLMHD